MADSRLMPVPAQDQAVIEDIIARIGNQYDIRVDLRPNASSLFSPALAVVGCIFGGMAGGRIGAAVGAGLGTLIGNANSHLLALAEVWEQIKSRLWDLIIAIRDILQRLDPTDLLTGAQIVMSRDSLMTKIASLIVHFVSRLPNVTVRGNIMEA